jgi:formylglycine-generating enzyme required for sulfatase activity
VEGAECKELGLKWLAIPGGTFQMGCSPDDDMCNQDELPAHQVTLGGFAMLETEVTEAQYEPILGVSPPCPYGFGVTGPNTPVECVTWFDAADFCEAVGGRLPTEAEWEYAARGGKATRYSCGDDPTCLDSTAWFEDNSGDMIQPVKGKEPNDYGLYDMIGNVWEWNSDWYSADYYSVSPDANPSGPDSGEIRSARGGSATTAEVKFLRVSFRHPAGPTAPVSGFRCVR